jgi:hypothetical protein
MWAKCSCSEASRSGISIGPSTSTGQVIDVLLREHRDLASAEAFFRHAEQLTTVRSSRLEQRRAS